MMHKRRIYVLLALMIAVLAACGGAETAPTAPEEAMISVAMGDIHFGDNNDNVANPPVWTVSREATVTLQVENNGALEHSWVLLKANEEIPVPFNQDEHDGKVLFDTGAVAAGSSAEFTFSAPTPGEYNVACTVPGHAALMQGRLIVNG